MDFVLITMGYNELYNEFLSCNYYLNYCASISHFMEFLKEKFSLAKNLDLFNWLKKKENAKCTTKNK